MKEKNQSKHCRWFLHNKECKESVIKKIVKDLNIQTDNLCQFLPQGMWFCREDNLDDCSNECDIFFSFLLDKVHDFSKLNPKDLLGKYISDLF